MIIPEIAETIKALRNESNKLKSDDVDTTETINQLIEKLEQQIESPTVENQHSLTDHLKRSVSAFEIQHPRLTSIVNDLMVKLAGLGV